MKHWNKIDACCSSKPENFYLSNQILQLKISTYPELICPLWAFPVATFTGYLGYPALGCLEIIFCLCGQAIKSRLTNTNNNFGYEHFISWNGKPKIDGLRLERLELKISTHPEPICPFFASPVATFTGYPALGCLEIIFCQCGQAIKSRLTNTNKQQISNPFLDMNTLFLGMENQKSMVSDWKGSKFILW